MGSSDPHTRTQNREKSRFFRVGAFWSWGRNLPLRMLQRVKPGPVILNLRKKFNLWNDTILNLNGRKKFISLHQWIRSCSLVFWDCKGVIVVDALPRGDIVKSDAYIRMLTEFGKHFKRVWPHKNPTESCLSMTMQGRTQAWRLRDLSQNLDGQC